MSKERPHLASLIAIGLTCLTATAAWALQTGDFLVADRLYGLIYVDATGTQRYLTGYINGHGVGDVASDASGNIYVIDASAGVVYKVDGVSGATTVVTSGGFLQFPSSIDIMPDGSLLVVEGGSTRGVVRVDATTGAQTMPVTGIIDALAVDANGITYVAMADGPTSWHLYRADLTTGATVSISNTAFSNPRSLAADASGNLIISEYYLVTVKRVDPATGAVTPVSSDNQFMAPWGVTLEANGMIIVADNQGLPACNPPSGPSTCRGALFSVHPATGTQTIVTEQDKFEDITGCDIYRGPNVMTPALGASWGRLKTVYR